MKYRCAACSHEFSVKSKTMSLPKHKFNCPSCGTVLVTEQVERIKHKGLMLGIIHNQISDFPFNIVLSIVGAVLGILVFQYFGWLGTFVFAVFVGFYIFLSSKQVHQTYRA